MDLPFSGTRKGMTRRRGYESIASRKRQSILCIPMGFEAALPSLSPSDKREASKNPGIGYRMPYSIHRR
jgi:hypothetical protein